MARDPFESAGASDEGAQIATRTSVLVMALMGGIASFAAVVVALPGMAGTGQGPGNIQPMLMALAALGCAALGVYAGFGAVAKRMARKAWDERADDRAGAVGVARVLLTTTIVRAGVVEGAALFGVMVVMMTGERMFLAAPGAGLVLLAFLVPGRARYESLLQHASGHRAGL